MEKASPTVLFYTGLVLVTTVNVGVGLFGIFLFGEYPPAVLLIFGWIGFSSARNTFMPPRRELKYPELIPIARKVIQWSMFPTALFMGLLLNHVYNDVQNFPISPALLGFYAGVLYVAASLLGERHGRRIAKDKRD